MQIEGEGTEGNQNNWGPEAAEDPESWGDYWRRHPLKEQVVWQVWRQGEGQEVHGQVHYIGKGQQIGQGSFGLVVVKGNGAKLVLLCPNDTAVKSSSSRDV